MAVQSSSSEDARTGEVQAPVSEAPTRQFAIFAGGEGCANCGSLLSSDQRYCVACGERRGRPRFPVADLAAPASPPEPVVAPPPRAATWSGGMTLVTGIATLLLAMGVGVLIGRTGQGSPQKAAAAPSVITVNGGGGAAPTPASSSTAGTSGKKAKPVKGLPPKKVIVKAQQQASKVLGGANLPPPTVKVGQSGTGPGFQGGKFTGNFFGQ